MIPFLIVLWTMIAASLTDCAMLYRRWCQHGMRYLIACFMIGCFVIAIHPTYRSESPWILLIGLSILVPYSLAQGDHSDHQHE